MATPTPKAEIHTPQASKHLPAAAAFSSPLPRSVPNTSASIGINYDSPAVLNMLQEGGVGMGISMSGMGMSQLGLSASAMGRADEDERRRRLESIIGMLKEKPGRVGEEGIVQLCKKMEVEVEKMDDEGLTLIIGNEAMCDIFIRNNEIENVKLMSNLDDEKQRPELRFGATGSNILLRSLKPLPGQNKINNTLDRFSQNLDKLLRLDKLGAPKNGGVSCYHAIAGVYSSLRKLFEHEKKMALAVYETNTPYKSQKAEREVLCKKSGRPRLNGGLCLGLSLEYWMDRRHIIRTSSPTSVPTSSKGKDKMDVDSEAADEYPEDSDFETNKIYSLTIDCESSPSSMFTPIRISDDWISDTITKPQSEAETEINNLLNNNASQIDWQDPKPTYLEAPTEGGDQDAMNLDNAPGRLPNIRFVAKFNPPLVVPLSVWISIQQSVGIEPNAQEFQATTFVGLALRPNDPDPGMLGTAVDSTSEVCSEKSILVVDGEGKEVVKKHKNSLYVPKMEYSRTLESLPFSHPRQLVEILPTLRQYAFTTSLIQHTFDLKAPKAVQKTQSTPLSPPLTPKEEAQSLQLDVTLAYTPPAPKLSLHIPHPSSTTLPSFNNSLANSTSYSDLLASLLSTTSPSTHPPIQITLDVNTNGELQILAQNVIHSEHDAAKDAGGDVDMDVDKANEVDDRKKRIARALDVCGDLGIWAEWVRREVRGKADLR